MFKTLFVSLALLLAASGVTAQYGADTQQLPSLTDPDQHSDECYVAPEWRSES